MRTEGEREKELGYLKSLQNRERNWSYPPVTLCFRSDGQVVGNWTCNQVSSPYLEVQDTVGKWIVTRVIIPISGLYVP